MTLVAYRRCFGEYRQSIVDDDSKTVRSEKEQASDLREVLGKGKLPCGARYCHRCHEECGVIVNAYILRDLLHESDRDGD